MGTYSRPLSACEGTAKVEGSSNYTTPSTVYGAHTLHTVLGVCANVGVSGSGEGDVGVSEIISLGRTCRRQHREVPRRIIAELASDAT